MKKILFLFFITLWITNSFAKTIGFPEHYYKIKNSTIKKNYFFDYLYPYIVEANKNILIDRKFILSMKLNKHLSKRPKKIKRLFQIAQKYKIENPYDYPTLLKRVDIVPPSMALAQAAVESGWGNSRFVKEGNNLFGHWTYGNKGMVPLNRDPNATHLVRIFNSFEESISAYMLNLNRTKAYYIFRLKRLLLRESNQKISGLILSQTMINYSTIKEKYLAILKSMIIKNDLLKYDKKFYNNLKKEKNEI